MQIKDITTPQMEVIHPDGKLQGAKKFRTRSA